MTDEPIAQENVNKITKLEGRLDVFSEGAKHMTKSMERMEQGQTEFFKEQRKDMREILQTTGRVSAMEKDITRIDAGLEDTTRKVGYVDRSIPIKIAAAAALADKQDLKVDKKVSFLMSLVKKSKPVGYMVAGIALLKIATALLTLLLT